MSLLNYLSFYSEFKFLTNRKWYILNQNKVIYLIIFNDIIFLKYHIGYSDYEDLLLYELEYEDFDLFKKELKKKKNTVNIHINSNYQLYLCDKTKLFYTNYFSNTSFDIVSHLKRINSDIQHKNFVTVDPLFIKDNVVFDSIDLGNFNAYEVQKDYFINDNYINKIFKVVKLDEVIWSWNQTLQVLRISNLDNDLNIYIKLIVRYE